MNDGKLTIDQNFKLCTKKQHFFVTANGSLINYTGLNWDVAYHALLSSGPYVGPLNFKAARELAIRISENRVENYKNMPAKDYTPFIGQRAIKAEAKKLSEAKTAWHKKRAGVR